MKEAFMVQGSYGRFGLTAAMLRRCKEFLNQGIQPTSLTFDFTDDIYTIVDELIKIGKMDKKILVKNPYLDLSTSAVEWASKLGNEEKEQFLLVKASKTETTYYYANGQNYDTRYYELKKLKSTDKKFNEGIIISEVIFRNDIKYQEKFYAKNGFCIAIREWGEDSLQKRFLTFDYSLGVVREYKNSYSWSVEWLKSLIFLSFLTNKKKPLLICDGPGSARKITEISSDIAVKAYVLHNNHKNLDDSFSTRDLWNLRNGHKFDAIIPLTQQHANDLKRDYPNLNNIFTIPNFTSISACDFKKNDYIKNRIGLFGQLIERKGITDAIKLVSLLREKYKLDIKLDIYGVSPTDTEKAIKHYSKISKENCVNDLVEFHGYSNDVANEMRKCLCVIFPSKSEAQPLTILESLSLGTPVVAYDCKYGPASMIEHGVNGLLCNVGDIETMASHVEKLYEDNATRNEMSIKAIESIKELTSKDKIYSMWQQLFVL